MTPTPPKVQRKQHPITCYGDPELIRRLDEYARSAGLDRSSAMRLILLATLKEPAHD